MKKQRTALGAIGLKVLLLAIGLAGLSQPTIANPISRDVAATGALPERVEAPSHLGGVSLERLLAWQTAAAYKSDYGAATADSRAGLSTAQDDLETDPIQTAAIMPGVFGSVALSMRNFPASVRWAPVYRAIVDCSADSACERTSTVFAKIVETAQGKGFSEKLSFVNSSINRAIAYRKDSVVYASFDYWAKPSEILERRAGDCEDFAILKMTALLRAGIPAQSMAVVVLQDRRRKFFHAVLSVNTATGTFILDNLSNTVVQDKDLPDYLPLYSFSTDRAWIHGSKSGGAQTATIKGGFATVAPGEGSQYP